MNILLLTIGMLLYVVINLNREYTHSGFNWSEFMWKHISALIVSLMLGLAVILTTDYGIILTELFDKIGGLTYVIIGFSGQTIFNGLIELTDNRIKTKWGRNK
jgi:hypothetical protein